MNNEKNLDESSAKGGGRATPVSRIINIDEALALLGKFIDRSPVTRKQFLTVKETAKYLGVSRSKIRKLIEDNEITYYTIFGKNVIPLREINYTVILESVVTLSEGSSGWTTPEFDKKDRLKFVE